MYTYNKNLIITLLLLLFSSIKFTYSEQCSRFDDCAQEDKDSKSLIIDDIRFDKFNIQHSEINANMIKILFYCDHEKIPELCDKARIAFKNAATIVTNTFELKIPIIVNASFVNLCDYSMTCLPD